MIRMSDVFKSESGSFIFGSIGRDVYQDIDANMIDIIGRFDTIEQAVAATVAIHHHDKLTEQRDMLRDALIELMDIVNVDTVEAVEAKIYAAQAVLEQLK